ncbi:MAG: recombinase family protein, partial [Oscillospiraceae bacterium]
MAQVKIIQPIAQQATKIRVAAYARVSSNSEDQLNSFATQVEHYTKLIEANADWVFADIYADAAITGTRADKRNEFQRLLQDCRAGKIDRVLVKSISRFARNTVDCIETVRELSLLDIAVAFEKENIDTSAMGGEMLLSMLGAAAQEESLSISQNLQWGIQRRMRKGEFVASTAPYGYERKGISLVPKPQQASNVKFIFDEYLTGKSSDQIALFLNQQSISAPNGTQWYARTVRSFLTNEKYKGDMLLQKQFTTDCLPLRRQVNRGERPQFYASQTHEPIITEDVFDTVQALLCSRNKKHAYKDEYKQYPFSRLLICGHCGTTFRRGTRKNGIVIWTCRNHFVDQCKCPMLPVLETDIHRALLCLYHKLLINYSHLLSPIL